MLRLLGAGAALALLPSAASAQRSAKRQLAARGRDWRVWPFSRRSPWNHPLGSGAQFRPVARLATVAIGINYDERWTCSVAVAERHDPLCPYLFSPNWGRASSWSFLDRGGRTCGNGHAAEQHLLRAASPRISTEGNYYSTINAANDHAWVLPASYHPASQDWRPTLRVPPGVCPSPDSDGLFAVMQPDGWVLDSYASVLLSSGELLGTMASWIDARGDGTGWWNGRRASMLPSFAGLIRSGEIASGRIPHALAMQAPPKLLRRAAVWPAYAFDRDSGYTGTVPMGALLAIPPAVDITRLGLSTPGLVIARAAQDYGVYVVDRGGDGLTILAELGNPDVRQGGGELPWWKDLERIRDVLQQVTNNSATNRGGGGVLRAALPPRLRAD
ncbi:MAG: hypothetical protein SF182_25045 [Deltaproteobacteria bacterium]|nr:hypothetical protein [Deltaproteobacteria bacterium]